MAAFYIVAFLSSIISEELKKMKWEPILPVEKKLVAWSLVLGIGLIALLVVWSVWLSRQFRAAQKDPASHRNLVVRIAGYSAYFVELSERMQNDIISRTENVV